MPTVRVIRSNPAISDEDLADALVTGVSSL
jgi:hypothetical protein